MRTETQIKREIVAYLDTLNQCYHVPYHSMGYGRRGVPDRLVCYKGKWLALECKRPPGEGKRGPLKSPVADPWQQREIEAIRAAAGYAYVVWSVEQVRQAIAAIDKVEDAVTGSDILDAMARNRPPSVEKQPDGSYKRVPLPLRKLSDG